MKLALISVVLTIAMIPSAAAQQLDADYNYYDEDIVLQNVNVPTDDLNLADPRDRDEVVWRIDWATRNACRPFPDLRELFAVSDYRRCRADAFDSGMAELEHRTARGHRRGNVTTREYPAPEPEQ